MAKRAQPNAAVKTKRGGPRNGSNAPSAEDVREYLNDVHEISDEMEARAGAYRSKIKAVWEKAAEDLGITKKSIQIIFRRERREIKDMAAMKKADTADRDALQKLGAALGDTPLGQYADRLAAGFPAEAREMDE